MGAIVEFDFSEVQASLRDFPPGPVEAEIIEATAEISKNSGNPMIVIKFEVTHPNHGSARLTDYLSPGFAAKGAKFWQAINSMSEDELRSQEQVGIDADNLVGSRLIVVLDEGEEDTYTDKNGNERKAHRRGLDYPWYYSEEQVDVLPYLSENDLPF